MQVTQQFIDKLTLHTILTSREQDAILALEGAVASAHLAGQLVGRGAPTNSVCLVLDGMIARVADTVEGDRQIAAFFVPGDIPDLYALLLPEALFTLQAVCDSRVLRVPKNAMKEVVMKYPTIAEALWRETLIDARIANEWILNLGRRQGRARVAHLICEIAHRVVELPSGNFTFALPPTQAQLGEATGMTAVHVNRVLQSLRAVAKISQHKAEIIDWHQLKSIAGFDPAYLSLPRAHRLVPA